MMTLAEALETTRLHRVAGLTSGPPALVTIWPSQRHTSPGRRACPPQQLYRVDLPIDVQSYTLPYLAGMARNSRLQVLSPPCCG